MLQEVLNNVDTQFVVYVGAFVGLLLAFEGVRQLLSRRGRQDEVRSKRMKLIAKGADTKELLEILKPEPKKSLFSRFPLIGDLPIVLRQAGITMSSGAFLTTSFAGAVAVSVIFSQLVGVYMAVIVAFLLCIFMPIMAVRLQRTQRINDLVKQLPDALELMSRGLMVGHPLNTTLQSVANEMSDPIATEFGVVVDQVAFGDDLADAFNEFADRMDQEDIQYLATAISIQHGTGGDLASILKTLARVIRDRMNMRKKIKAISSEGRLSAAILSVVPVIIFVGMNLMAPKYFGDVADEPLAKPLAFIVVTLILLNALILRKLVNFRF